MISQFKIQNSKFNISYSVPILFEDDVLIFVDKPPGLVVQRNYDPEEPVLIEEVTRFLEARGETAFLMQRLDRGTSGVMFFTKRPEVNAKVTRQFEKKVIRKRYVALVEGEIREPREIDSPLRRIGPIKFAAGDGGKHAVTIVEPLQWSARASVVQLTLLTGRTHQIRVHMSSIGHPLVGDWLYGERSAARPMLHSHTLTMLHPVTQEPLTVSAALPEDFVEACAERGLTGLRIEDGGLRMED